MSLVPKYKLVDFVTGEIVGYIYSYLETNIAVTKEKAVELGLESADYIEYLDLEVWEVLSHNNKYALLSNAILYYPIYSDTEFDRLDDEKVIIWGYIFEKYHLVSLDDDSVINQVLLERGRVDG